MKREEKPGSMPRSQDGEKKERKDNDICPLRVVVGDASEKKIILSVFRARQ